MSITGKKLALFAALVGMGGMTGSERVDNQYRDEPRRCPDCKQRLPGKHARCLTRECVAARGGLRQ